MVLRLLCISLCISEIINATIQRRYLMINGHGWENGAERIYGRVLDEEEIIAKLKKYKEPTPDDTKKQWNKVPQIIFFTKSWTELPQGTVTYIFIFFVNHIDHIYKTPI